MDNREKDVKAKDLFRDTCMEATFDIPTLERIFGKESKFRKIKRELDVQLISDGQCYKIRGTKENLDKAKDILLKKLDENEKIIVYGIENADIVSAFLSGKKWGNADDCQKLKKLNKKFSICPFSMFIAKNSDRVWEKLSELHCELVMESINGDELKVAMKGPQAYVDSIFKFIEGEFKASCFSVIHNRYTRNVRNKKSFMYLVQERLNPVFMIYQGTHFYVVFQEADAERISLTLGNQLDILAKESDSRKVAPDFKKLLNPYFDYKTENQKASTAAKQKPAKEQEAHEPTTVIALDRDYATYLKEFAWKEIADKAAEHGIVPTLVERGIQLCPMKRDFENDSKVLDSKLKEYLATIKSKSVPIPKPFDELEPNMRSMLEEKAKELHVRLKSVSRHKTYQITAMGTGDAAEEFIRFAQTVVSARSNERSNSSSGNEEANELQDQSNGVLQRQRSSDSENGHSAGAMYRQNSRYGEQNQCNGAYQRQHSRDSEPRSRSTSNSEPSSRSSRDRMHMTVYRHTESGVKIHCGLADITKLKVDCIVNAANEDLRHIGGVAYAISRAAGSELERESNRFIREHGPLDVSGVCVTTAGRMPCSRVLHTVGPMWNRYTNHDECIHDLQAAFYNCLQEAQKHHLNSIAFPAISSGIFGVPMHLVSRAACEAICMYCVLVELGRDHVTDIYLVDISRDTIESFNSTLATYVSNGALSTVSSAI